METGRIGEIRGVIMTQIVISTTLLYTLYTLLGIAAFSIIVLIGKTTEYKHRGNESMNKRITTLWNTLWTTYLAEMTITVAIIAWCLIAVRNLPHTPEFFQRLQIAAYAIGLIIGLDIAWTMATTREEVLTRLKL